MPLLRLLALLLLILIIGGVLGYVLTGKVNYLRFSQRLFKYALFSATGLFLLFMLERLFEFKF